MENVAALVAYGVGLDGHRRLLGITIGAQESEESWAELLRQLIERGLSGDVPASGGCMACTHEEAEGGTQHARNLGVLYRQVA